ncbi:MAG: hypothetical protein JW969_12960 [Spirochaetales bacterium]|nr:hypothetical protein [Spirochaetales bacterium]
MGENENSIYPAINDSFLDLFRDLIKANFGINISREKDYLLKSKLGKLLRDSVYKNAAEFYYTLKNGEASSLEKLVRYITTTYTYFFREPMHLKILCNDIKLRGLENPLIWCAGSSTGEEVYSMIIELLEHGITRFLIVATDLNRDVLLHMKRGVYREDRLKNADRSLLLKYFREIEDERGIAYSVNGQLKQYYIAKRLNLVDELRFESDFDYIFCRNVLIYFNRETQQKVVNTLIRNLKDTGYLFVGHSESLLNLQVNLESVFTSVYNKKK